MLHPGEKIAWSDIGITGLLGRPYLNMVPVMLGSAFWDIALTSERFLAVELPVVESSRDVGRL
jgi:hypothetical protein